jgi:hypothetical protein
MRASVPRKLPEVRLTMPAVFRVSRFVSCGQGARVMRSSMTLRFHGSFRACGTPRAPRVVFHDTLCTGVSPLGLEVLLVSRFTRV